MTDEQRVSLGEPDIRRADKDAEYGFEVWSLICTTCSGQWYGPEWEACPRCVTELETAHGRFDEYQARIDTPTPPPGDWPEPLPLHEHARPPFPLEALPSWISDQARQAATEMQLTPDLAAQLSITALSVITASRVTIRVRGPWHEPTNTYLVTALPPSAGKSPTFSMMLGPLDGWEEELSIDGAKRAEDRELERRHLERLRDDALKKGELSQAKMHADDLRDMPSLHAPRLLADDATPEKLVEILSQQGGRLALVSTEGGLFGMMTGRYSDKTNLDVYLGAWSGDTIRVDRVERGSLVVRNPHLSVGLTVQPDVIARIGKNKELVGRGLTARFMYVIPADTVGHRSKSRRSTYDDKIAQRYQRALLDLAHRLPDLDDTDLVLEMSPTAVQRFNEWQDEREALLGAFGPLRYMAEWIAKCDSTTARVAGLIHLADGNTSTTIDIDVVERAITIGDYWTAHARAAFDIMGSSDDLGHARYILGWLRNRQVNEPTITFRDIHQGGAKRRVETPGDLVDAVEMLVEHGWLRPLFRGRLETEIGRGKSSPTFDIHPSLSVLTCPHCPHSNAECDNCEHNLTENVQVRTKRTEIPNTPGDHIHSFIEPGGEDPPNPVLTVLTSTTTVPEPYTTAEELFGDTTTDRSTTP